MSRFWPRAASIAIATMLLACSGATEPRRTDVDLARSRWLATHPRTYSFEVATTGAWMPASGYFRVRVSDGRVVEARDPAANLIADFTLTVDGSGTSFSPPARVAS